MSLSNESTRLVNMNEQNSYQNVELGGSRSVINRHNPFEQDLYEGNHSNGYSSTISNIYLIMNTVLYLIELIFYNK